MIWRIWRYQRVFMASGSEHININDAIVLGHHCQGTAGSGLVPPVSFPASTLCPCSLTGSRANPFGDASFDPYWGQERRQAPPSRLGDSGSGDEPCGVACLKGPSLSVPRVAFSRPRNRRLVISPSSFLRRVWLGAARPSPVALTFAFRPPFQPDPA
ncbi:hypothetical protein LZ30DRAFT_370454 [Colletotrichum cereale]|nr:hypothetical protein LZ30DRAFT_370454 [Colletotrichum cereale]